MAAIDLLRQQHQELEGLFTELRTAERRAKIALLGRLAEDLTVHATLKERFLYPVAERIPELTQVIADARRVHAQTRGWISEIMELKQRDPRIDTLVSQIERTIADHVAVVEREVFPRLEEDSEAMAQLGAQMEQAQRELRGQELLEAADSGPVPQA